MSAEREGKRHAKRMRTHYDGVEWSTDKIHDKAQQDDKEADMEKERAIA